MSAASAKEEERRTGISVLDSPRTKGSSHLDRVGTVSRVKRTSKEKLSKAERGSPISGQEGQGGGTYAFSTAPLRACSRRLGTITF